MNKNEILFQSEIELFENPRISMARDKINDLKRYNDNLESLKGGIENE